jgi:acyl-CoA thioesterase FadM
MISAAPEEMATRKLGWADVRQVIEYHKEVRSGILLVIRSGVVRIGNKSVEHRHEMRGAFDDVLHSTLEGVTAFFDLEKRAAAPLEDWIREKASGLLLPPQP